MSASWRRRIRHNRIARNAYSWLLQFVDAGRLVRGLGGLRWYWSDYRRYRHLAALQEGPRSAERIELLPALHERAPRHELDAHYFYVNAWAMRRVLAAGPDHHVDIGSQLALAGLLSAALPVTYLDYRPVAATVPGLSRVSGSLLALPCADGSLRSVSCLHVAEHVGLGRYGDPLDPAGTRKAAAELERVVAVDGDLYFALPLGRPRVCFNAHRVHSVEMVLALFPRLRLRELSGVTDDGRFLEDVRPDAFAGSEYACGMFWFRRERT
ncbi:MAG TPA: DUF268 domain-containing protein [Longimicrobiales bacterium]|nr:DUF268 domain-containing protein [Longimicrobiales bacterium]